MPSGPFPIEEEMGEKILCDKMCLCVVPIAGFLSCDKSVFPG